jgi:predicted metal-binding protein
MQIDNYRVLEKKALKLGFASAKIILMDDVVIEDRLRLQCMVSCSHYGKNLKCPPYAPSMDEFRKMLNEYSFAMVVKFKPPEISDEIIAKYNLAEGAENPQNMDKVTIVQELENQLITANETQDIDKMALMRSDFAESYKNALMDLLELEKAAFKQGYTLATVFFYGACWLCEKCNIETGICRNPRISRYSTEVAGINIVKTAENAGMGFKFPIKDDELGGLVLLLID